MAVSVLSALSEELAKYALEGSLKELKRAMLQMEAKDDDEGATISKSSRVVVDINASVSKAEDTLLHLALSRNHRDIVEYLLVSASATINVNATNKQGVTPLMKAVVSSPNLVELLLQHGADPMARNWKGGRHKTSIDLAGNNPEMKALLQQHVLLTATSSSLTTTTATADHDDCCCQHCGAQLKKRTRLDYMLDRTPNLPTNKYIDDFRTSPACHALVTEPDLYHVLTNKHHLRKEITESWALLTTLMKATTSHEHAATRIDDLNDDMFLVDLCSGSALTVALFGILYPQSRGLAVDIVNEEFAAHLRGNVSYLQADIWKSDFLQVLQDEILLSSGTAVLVGMHLCGKLSARAIEVFAETSSFQMIVLCPCCFPKKRPTKKDLLQDANKNTKIVNGEHDYDHSGNWIQPNDKGLSFNFTYGQDEEANYTAWSSHLLELLSKCCSQYSIQRDKDMLSKRNAMIVGYR